jgi:sigma-B regulation protein RsbU (phosphoserine phosphatase)
MSPEAQSPEEILRRVSDALSSQNPRNMFVTLLCSIYDPATGRLNYASAGHPAAVLLRAGQASLLPTEADLAAGIMAGLTAKSESVDLQPGDQVVFYTDGVTEAFNAAGDLFGDAQMLEALSRKSGGNASETTAALLSRVREHAGAHPQSDDIAILTLRRK